MDSDVIVTTRISIMGVGSVLGVVPLETIVSETYIFLERSFAQVFTL